MTTQIQQLAIISQKMVCFYENLSEEGREKVNKISEAWAKSKDYISTSLNDFLLTIIKDKKYFKS